MSDFTEKFRGVATPNTSEKSDLAENSDYPNLILAGLARAESKGKKHYDSSIKLLKENGCFDVDFLGLLQFSGLERRFVIKHLAKNPYGDRYLTYEEIFAIDQGIGSGLSVEQSFNKYIRLEQDEILLIDTYEISRKQYDNLIKGLNVDKKYQLINALQTFSSQIEKTYEPLKMKDITELVKAAPDSDFAKLINKQKFLEFVEQEINKNRSNNDMDSLFKRYQERIQLMFQYSVLIPIAMGRIPIKNEEAQKNRRESEKIHQKKVKH